MESNRDDAARCVALARAAMSAKDVPRARRLLAKSHRMYPTEAAAAGTPDGDLHAARTAAEAELVTAGRSAARAAADADVAARAAENLRRRRADEAADAAARAAAPPTHTPEQATLVRRLTVAKTHYEVIGVDKAAVDEDSLRRAYRRLALKVHPDKNPAPGAEAAFQKLTTAYEVLSDPTRRAAYDLHGDAAENGSARSGASAASPFGMGGGMRGGGGSDPFADLMAELFRQQTAGGGGQRRGPRRRAGGGVHMGGGGVGMDDTDFLSWLFAEQGGGRGRQRAAGPGNRGGRRAHARRQAGGAAAADEQWTFSSFSLWAVILAVLFWLFVGGGLGTTHPVALRPTHTMPVQRLTPNAGVPFYTASDWPPHDMNRATVRKWLRWVEVETLDGHLVRCREELDRRAQLQAESHRIFVYGQAQRRQFADKAAAMPMRFCKKYEALRVAMGERNRSPYTG
ncbi:hypothetical protein BU14_0422s0019 [Porphyra umbilicalis]|uniref:J domain-containing protein n=1 Tax=Porphyra umbilicalis TaxID=2786 RepID=A0A1X6NVI2_PORUM|nr:hypothetical protein BU14_0422s0019 [Porphyra umbilicalis]|eukprot:OSX72587.1 hypothetical protein BU14_0422s0019 [Porphyra umbilicalis]